MPISPGSVTPTHQRKNAMFNTEFKAMLELLAMLILNWRTGILFALLITAAIIDYRSHRIPNWLVFSGALFGVLYNMLAPPFPHASLLWPFQGLGMGLIVLLPLYLLGVMGAGDVKLMAMVGAIVGPADMVWVLLYTMMVGGVLAIIFVLARGTATRMWRNLNSLFLVGFFNALDGVRPNLHIDARLSAGKLPYGVAIAIGTIGYLTLHQLGFL